MSTDYHLVCEKCLAYIHAGQTMAGPRFTAGFGAHDKEGQEEVGAFLLRHQHGQLGSVFNLPLKFMNGQAVPDGYKDEGSP
jgi:hypothetical protein